LIDGALGAGWSPGQPNITDYHWDELFQILTGEEVELEDTEALDSATICEPFAVKYK
jgi:hypothetical protein